MEDDRYRDGDRYPDGSYCSCDDNRGQEEDSTCNYSGQEQELALSDEPILSHPLDAALADVDDGRWLMRHWLMRHCFHHWLRSL